jgi:SAM-dependent methyltransferase
MKVVYDWQIPGTRAEIYDGIFLPAVVDDWSPRLADRASLEPNDRVLDVACGTGAWALCAASRLGPGGRVVGIDNSPEMLAVARGKSVARLPAVVEWHDGSAEAIPFADASFDVVCCQLGLMFFPDKMAALREMLGQRRIQGPDADAGNGRHALPNAEPHDSQLRGANGLAGRNKRGPGPYQRSGRGPGRVHGAKWPGIPGRSGDCDGSQLVSIARSCPARLGGKKLRR